MEQQLHSRKKLSKWQRFIDVLSNGPPNHEKLKGKRWFVRYNVTLVGLISCFAFLWAPEIVSRLNGVPDPASLQTLQVRILRTHLTEPHLFVEMPDGSQRGMEWPVPISGGPGQFRSNVWSDDQREQLPGCLATVGGTPLRWVINDRFRIWQLNCPAKSIQIGFEKAEHDFEKWVRVGVVPALVVNSFICLLILVVFLREKRGNL